MTLTYIGALSARGDLVTIFYLLYRVIQFSFLYLDESSYIILFDHYSTACPLPQLNQLTSLLMYASKFNVQFSQIVRVNHLLESMDHLERMILPNFFSFSYLNVG